MAEYQQWDSDDVSDLADWLSDSLSEAARADGETIQAKLVAKALGEVDWREVSEMVLEAAVNANPVSD